MLDVLLVYNYCNTDTESLVWNYRAHMHAPSKITKALTNNVCDDAAIASTDMEVGVRSKPK